MGGNALKSLNTIRLNKENYFKLTNSIFVRLATIFPNRKIDLIPAYRAKESFGDADFIIECDNIQNVKQLLIKEFQPKELVQNNNVFSFDVENFQIDLILTSSKNYHNSLNYFSYNDLGNLIGKLYHKAGLKYGHDGLSYVLRDGTYEVGTIHLSSDIDKILDFICLPKDVYHKGFDTLEDIFKFVSSTPLFNPDIYLLDNLNHISRVRDRKRKTYQEFLKWCEDNKSKLTHYQWNKDKFVYFDRINEVFPNFKPELKRLEEKRQKSRERHEKFNGDIIKQLTGLEGVELGKFIRGFKSNFGGDNWEKFIDNHSTADIVAYIKVYYNLNI